MSTVDPDAIGISYKIDLTKLGNSIIAANAKLEKFHKDLAGLAQKASVTITVKDQSITKAKIYKYENNVYYTRGKYTKSGNKVNFTELPVGLWIENYKIMLEMMV